MDKLCFYHAAQPDGRTACANIRELLCQPLTDPAAGPPVYIPKTADESLEIANYSTEELRQKIRSFLDKPYFAACDFCAGRPRGVVDIPAAVQTPTPLPYHKYDD